MVPIATSSVSPAAAQFVDQELEARVLAALAAGGEEEFYRLSDWLAPACFPSYEAAFRALADAVADGRPVPTGALPDAELPPGFDLNIAVRTLAELARKRLAAEALERAWAELPGLPADQVILRTQEALMRAEEAVRGVTAGRLLTLADPEIAAEMDKRLKEVRQAVALTGHPVPFPPTRMPAFDRATGGIQPGVWVLAAREGMSKTHFALWLALQFLNAAETAAVYVTAEEPPWRLRLKAICGEEGLNWHEYASQGRGDPALLASGAARWDAGKGRRMAVMEVTENTTMAHVRAKAKAFQRRLKARQVLVVLDYLQALAHTEAGAVQEKWLEGSFRHRIERVSRQAVAMANQEGWTVLCVAALNREGDTRESGGVNFDCDLYLALEWPPDKDQTAAQANGNPANPVKHKDLHVRKNRYTGWTGTIRVLEMRHQSKFGEPSSKP